jgi:ATP-dependent DNA helicase RecQ
MREQERIELALTIDRVQADEEPLLPPTALQTFTLFSNGRSVEEIAAERGLVVNTIEGHLIECLSAGLAVDISRLVSESDRAQIEKAISQLGLENGFKPIRESLPETITYNMIRFVVAARGK